MVKKFLKGIKLEMERENIFKKFFRKTEGSAKKIKKSEIAIYAIALMLVTAGYYNYSTFNKNTEETYSEDVSQINEQYANVGDAVLVSNNDSQNENNSNDTDTNSLVSNENVENENIVDNQTEVNTTEHQEVQQVNTEVTVDESDYYASSKLERDKMYAEMISTYEQILNNTNVTEAQKTIATQEIAKINNNKNAIMICENLILTKGFKNCVILINDASINIVTNIEGGLTTDAVAKIQNIVSRELKTEIENIHITEK